jgi:hypothetical protein
MFSGPQGRLIFVGLLLDRPASVTLSISYVIEGDDWHVMKAWPINHLIQTHHLRELGVVVRVTALKAKCIIIDMDRSDLTPTIDVVTNQHGRVSGQFVTT